MRAPARLSAGAARKFVGTCPQVLGTFGSGAAEHGRHSPKPNWPNQGARGFLGACPGGASGLFATESWSRAGDPSCLRVNCALHSPELEGFSAIEWRVGAGIGPFEGGLRVASSTNGGLDSLPWSGGAGPGSCPLRVACASRPPRLEGFSAMEWWIGAGIRPVEGALRVVSSTIGGLLLPGSGESGLG